MNYDSDFAMTIDGKPVSGAGTLDVVNPATGAVFAQAPDCSRAQLDDAVAAARRAIEEGASVVLAETLGSIGAALHAGPGKAVVGLDINATHHRAARSGLVTGVATPISLGRTLACYEIVVTDDTGARTCTSRITCLIRDAAPGA